MARAEKKYKVSRKLKPTALPTHLGIILDGNGRWATKRGLPRSMGHKAGCENLKQIIEFIYDLGIKIATFFMFSTENWKRPKSEIDGIFNLAREYIHENIDQFVEKGVKIVTIGDITKLPKDLYNKILEGVEKTKNCDKFILNLAINYGGRDEILRAVNIAIDKGKALKKQEDFAKLLYTADLTDPDFVIRTSGEQRVSNFMLYQMAYSEFYFSPRLWPDFHEKHLEKALLDFQKRKRRFGAIK